MTPPNAEPIGIYSDYVCPFCYLGRESLRQYQATREEPLRIDWQPFDLRASQRDPDGELDPAADSGKDEAYYEQARQNVRRLAERFGVELSLDLATDVDSLPAQVASEYVRETADYETWLAFDEAVFDALWQDGRDVGDRAVLSRIADEVGLDGADVTAAVDDEDRRDRLFEQFADTQRRGITGVPTFAYDGHLARGAVPPEHLRRLVEGG
ncbi:MAG: DsbA family protein [Haloarculaceae archaeon]